jgi:hypothetical protein
MKMQCDSGSNRRRRNLAFYATIAMTILAVPGASALDLKGRTDTGYQLELGDNATVNRAFNYESIDLGIAKGLSLSLYGGLLSAIGDRVNGSDANGLPETSDNALRNLQDALSGPGGSWVSYSLYHAQINYNTPLFGLSFGRSAGQGSSLAPYDGLSCWLVPTDWLRIEAFGGLPWQDANIAKFADLSTKITAGEFELGGEASASFAEGAVSAGLGYVLLSQESYATGTLGSTPAIVQSGLGTASIAWNPSNLFGAGAAASFIDLSPLEYSAWSAGALESLHLAYNLRVSLQPVDAAAVADSFDAFAAVLSASQAYFSSSLGLTEDITSFIPAPGFMKAAQLELGCDYRQPLGAADSWNPQYLQFSAGPLVAIMGGLSISAYYDYLLSLGSDDNISTLSGELREKISSLDIRLGSSFDANHFEADPSSNSILESFDTQEYYLKVKWQATKALDFSLKASYSSFRLATSTTPALTDATLIPAVTTVTTQLNDQARNVLHLDIRAGFRY